jgi:hypothetical protein
MNCSLTGNYLWSRNARDQLPTYAAVRLRWADLWTTPRRKREISQELPHFKVGYLDLFWDVLSCPPSQPRNIVGVHSFPASLVHLDVIIACSPSGGRAAVDFVDGIPRHIRCDDGCGAVREFSLGADLNQDSRRPFFFCQWRKAWTS